MSESYRMYASISFVAVLIIVGMPLWWKTTEVYRVSLPFARIYNLESIDMKIHSVIKIASANADNAIQLKYELAKQFENSNVFDLDFVTIPLPKIFDGSMDMITNFEDGLGSLMLIEWPNLDSDVFVTSSRTIFYRENIFAAKLKKVIREWIFAENSIKTTIAAMSTPAAARHDAAGQRRIPPSSIFDISLSIASPKPDQIKIEWNPKEAIERYFQPFVSHLSTVHNFTLKSQWLYFVQLDFNPKQVLDDTILKRHYSLYEDVLPHLITPLEKKLGSHTSNNPCLNFVLYVPPCESAPIHIYSKKGVRINGTLDAFLSPRWGGVVIGNPSAEVCSEYLNGDQQEIPVYRPPTKQIMGYFLSQLRLLLGIQSLNPISDVEIQSLETILPRKWEMDSLMRMRTIEQVTSAKLTLRSLSQLLGEISNIVINDDVGASIYNAVESIEVTGEYLKTGNLLKALESSRSAFLSAEAAFTDPSLLALLYFPDDQKYAVYIPLFLPVMIPVIISLKNIWYWLRNDGSSKEKTD